MAIIDVEVVGSEAAQAVVDCAKNRWPRKAWEVRRIAHLVSNLARQNKLVPPPCQQLTQHLFGRSAVIGIGGVQKVNAGIDAPVDHFRRNNFIGLPSEGHVPETDSG